jgi:arsenate reductase
VPRRPFNVLFVCTANSARSILAEALLNQAGAGRFRAFSAGSFPVGQVNPHAARELRVMGADAADFRSKSWDEFAAPDAPVMDFVITVCDQAAGETCPVWPGHPVSAHWSIPDPARAQGDDDAKRLAFAQAAHQLQLRIHLFASLPDDKLDAISLERVGRLLHQPL